MLLDMLNAVLAGRETDLAIQTQQRIATQRMPGAMRAGVQHMQVYVQLFSVS